MHNQPSHPSTVFPVEKNHQVASLFPTMSQKRLNHCLTLHVHKSLTDKLNLMSIAEESVSETKIDYAPLDTSFVNNFNWPHSSWINNYSKIFFRTLCARNFCPTNLSLLATPLLVHLGWYLPEQRVLSIAHSTETDFSPQRSIFLFRG